MKLSFVNYAKMLINNNYENICGPSQSVDISKRYLSNMNFDIFKHDLNNLLYNFPDGRSKIKINELFKI